MRLPFHWRQQEDFRCTGEAFGGENVHCPRDSSAQQRIAGSLRTRNDPPGSAPFLRNRGRGNSNTARGRGSLGPNRKVNRCQAWQIFHSKIDEARTLTALHTLAGSLSRRCAISLGRDLFPSSDRFCTSDETSHYCTIGHSRIDDHAASLRSVRRATTETNRPNKTSSRSSIESLFRFVFCGCR